MDDLAGHAQPGPAGSKLLASLRAALPWRGVLSVALPLLALAGLFLIVRPFGGDDATDPGTAIYAAWDDNIARLAIDPVYPPAEDFYVGDVMLIVTDAANASLVGKTVKIGHIDLSDTFLAISHRSTTESGVPSTGEAQAETVVSTPYGNVPTTFVGFPGFVVAKRTKRSGSWLWRAASASLDAQGDDAEELSIPLAESYQADVPTALGRFLVWCEDAKTSLFCKESYLRKLLSFYAGDEMAPSGGQQPRVGLAIELVTQAYLTRHIHHVEKHSQAGNAAVGPSDAKVASPNESLALSNARSLETQLDEAFPRPVVFGYRGVTLQVNGSH